MHVRRAIPILLTAIACRGAAGQTILRAVPEAPGLADLDARPASPGGGDSGPFEMDWCTIDGGGAMYLVGGVGAAAFSLGSTAGQPDAGVMSAPPGGAGGFTLSGGFWPGTDTEPAHCYANCDGSTTPPVLNVSDFTCFVNLYAAGHASANCDGSTVAPVLNINDFICFQQRFAVGCT